MIRSVFFFLLFVCPSSILAQYTDQINSNRPGASIGAFSVGTRVIQFEAGAEYRTYKHKGYNKSSIQGSIGFYALRYGFWKEQLELTYEGTYQLDKLKNKTILPEMIDKREGFLNHFLGVKYLVFDPFRKEREINVYSWKVENKEKAKNKRSIALLPDTEISKNVTKEFIISDLTGDRS